MKRVFRLGLGVILWLFSFLIVAALAAFLGWFTGRMSTKEYQPTIYPLTKQENAQMQAALAATLRVMTGDKSLQQERNSLGLEELARENPDLSPLSKEAQRRVEANFRPKAAWVTFYRQHEQASWQRATIDTEIIKQWNVLGEAEFSQIDLKRLQITRLEKPKALPNTTLWQVCPLRKAASGRGYSGIPYRYVGKNRQVLTLCITPGKYWYKNHQLHPIPLRPIRFSHIEIFQGLPVLTASERE